PFAQAPTNTNWATAGRYEAIGAWLQANTEDSAVIEMRGEIGTLAYASHRTLVNEFSDMSATEEWIALVRSSGLPPVRLLYRLNYRFRTVRPAGAAPTYVLEQELLPADQDPLDALPPEAVMIWTTTSRWAPSGLLLRRSRSTARNDPSQTSEWH